MSFKTAGFSNFEKHRPLISAATLNQENLISAAALIRGNMVLYWEVSIRRSRL